MAVRAVSRVSEVACWVGHWGEGLLWVSSSIAPGGLAWSCEGVNRPMKCQCAPILAVEVIKCNL
jgi:hypothetical protein